MLGEGASGDSKPQIAVSEKHKAKSPPVWQEIKSDDGNSYYWNTVTNGKFLNHNETGNPHKAHIVWGAQYSFTFNKSLVLLLKITTY